MEWQTTNALPGMLVCTRQFVSSARWWCVTIWNGLDDGQSREWEFLEAGKTEAEVITKAADALRQLPQ
jgi:hypothetical protein